MTDDQQPVMFIAGGTGSIGSEIARQALAGGWRVIIHGRSQLSVEQSLDARRLEYSGEGLRGLWGEVRAPRAMAQLAARAIDQFGRLDAVVDCIATGPEGVAGAFEETDPDNYGEMAEWSLVSLQRLARAALPALRETGGTLIAFTSDAGRFAAPRQVLIGASRAAIIGFVRNLALEVARDGVRVNGISPGFVAESRVAERLAPVSRERLQRAENRAGLGLPTPRDIAPLVLFLCGPGARRITGQVVSVNGGMNA